MFNSKAPVDDVDLYQLPEEEEKRETEESERINLK